MTDMNNSIGDKPIYTAKPTQATFSGREEPVCDCPDCSNNENSVNQTDLKDDPRAVIGRSQVQQRRLTPEVMESIQEAIGDMESLEDIREELIKGNLKAGYPPDVAEYFADDIILDMFGPKIPKA